MYVQGVSGVFVHTFRYDREDTFVNMKMEMTIFFLVFVVYLYVYCILSKCLLFKNYLLKNHKPSHTQFKHFQPSCKKYKQNIDL